MAYLAESVQRKLAILSGGGWITGTLRVAKMPVLIDAIEGIGEFLRLSEVRLPNTPAPIPFFALHRSSVMYIVPLDDPQRAETTPFTKPTLIHEVSCLFDQGVLSGTLEILTGMRVSDYLVQRAGFMPVRGCTWHGAAATGAPATFPLALVNRQRVVGVSESSAELTPRLEIARQKPVTPSAGSSNLVEPTGQPIRPVNT